MEGYNLHEELSPELWRATSEEGKRVLVKFPKDGSSLSVLSACRREYEIGGRLRDVEGVLAPRQVLEGNDLVGLLLEDCGGDLLSKYLLQYTSDRPVDEFLHIAINRMYML